MKERAAMVLAGVCLHLLLYGAAIPYSFSWDDRAIVLGDSAVRGESPLAAAAVRPWAYEEGARGVNYRPVTLLSLGLDVRLFGLKPAPLRTVNLLLAGAGAALFGILVRSMGAGPWAAWGALLLLSFHPVRVEPVLSLAGRGELLSFLFLAAALVARRRPLLSGFWLLLSLLSKESAFVAPALLALVVLAERERGGAGAAPGTASRLREHALLAAAWGGAFAAAFTARAGVLGGLMTGPRATISPADNLLAALPAGERLQAALSLLPLAFGRLLWPRTLSPDYSRTTFLAADLLAPSAVAAGAAVLLAAAIAAALLLGVPALRRVVPLAGFGVAWALVSYLPFANLLFPTGIAFTERLLFLPAAGVVAAVVAAGAALGGEGWPSSRNLAVALSGILLLLLGSARILRALPDWRDDRALMEAIERDLPTNSKAPWNLALLSLGEGKTDEAARHLARAVALDPNYRVQARELVVHAEKIGRPDVAAALAAALRTTDRTAPASRQLP